MQLETGNTYQAIAGDLEVLLGHWGLVDVTVKITTRPGQTLTLNYTIYLWGVHCALNV